MPFYRTSQLSLIKQYFKNRITNITVNERIKKVFDIYEEFIGIKEVRKTQESVLKVESEFADSSKLRRNMQNDLIRIQDQLKQIRQKLDSIHRSDESYLPLITTEHELIKSELRMLNSLRSLEENERDLFTKFSQKLRDAHEVERLRQEKTKYLSVIGSIVGAALGIIATSINHALKRKDFKEIAKMIESQQSLHNPPLNLVNNSQVSVEKESLENCDNSKPNLLQLNSETQTENDKIVEVITQTESNLEYKMKINSLTTVVATYALIALTLPIILRFLSD